MRVSVIVPVYNEERRIATALFELNSYLESHFDDFELIVVDDGSEDDTLNVLKDLPFAALSVFSFSAHRGRGEAVRFGFAHAGGYDAVIVFDADLSVSPVVIGQLLETAHHQDTPFVFTDPVVPFNSYYRRLSSVRARRLASAILGIAHIACGTKYFSASFARLILPKTRMNTLGLDAELLYIASLFGVRPTLLPTEPQNLFQGWDPWLLLEALIAFLKIRRLALRKAYEIEKTKEWGGFL